MDINDTDITSTESDGVIDLVAGIDNSTDAPNSTEVDEFNTGGLKIDTSNKQDSCQADAEVYPNGGDQHLGKQAEAPDKLRAGKESDTVTNGNNIEDIPLSRR